MGECILEAGKFNIAWDEMEIGGDFLEFWLGDIADARQRFHALEDRGAGGFFLPECLDPVLVEERGGEIGLRVEICDHDTLTQCGEGPRKVVNQRRLADTTLVIEECQDRRVHDFFLRVQTMALGVTLNSSGGLPFFSSSRRAMAMPRPNA